MAGRSSRASSASRDMPASCGASHSDTSAVSAASDRSGQLSSGSSRRISATRAWNWRVGIGPGQRPQPLRRRRRGPAPRRHRPGPPARCGRRGPARRAARRRRASTAPETGSKLVSTCSVTRSARQRVGIERRGQPDAGRRLQSPARRPPAAARWRADRRAAAVLRRRPPAGSCRARPAAARSGRETPRPAAGRDRHRRGASARSRSRRRYWPATRRMRDSAPRSAAGSPSAIAARRRPISAGASGLRSGSRSSSSAARSAASAASPGVPAASIIAASRGCAPSAAMRRPASVMRPCGIQRAKLAKQRGRGGRAPRRRRIEERADRPAACPRRRSPAPAPTARPRGSPAGRRRPGPRCSAVDHSRIATPGASRPARPARCSAAAREMRSVVSRVRPVAGSSRGARRQPPSTTMRTPGTVSEVSAIDVASTTPPRLGRPQRAILIGWRQVAMQRQHQRAAALQRRLGTADLGHAGQEGEDVAVVRRQRRTHGAGHCLGQFAWTGDVARGVADRDREHVPAALDHLRVHQSGKAGDLGGGRHGDQPQFRAQHTLQIAAQRQRQVGFHRTLVHLVQDHGGDAVEHRIGLQPTDQQALGDDLDAGRRRRRRHPAECGIRRCRRRPRRAARPSGWRRRGWRAGAAPASGWCRRRATPHRAARAAPASSCRRPAAPTSTTLRPAASAASNDGMAWLMGSSGNMLAIRRDLCYM